MKQQRQFYVVMTHSSPSRSGNPQSSLCMESKDAFIGIWILPVNQMMILNTFPLLNLFFYIKDGDLVSWTGGDTGIEFILVLANLSVDYKSVKCCSWLQRGQRKPFVRCPNMACSKMLIRIMIHSGQPGRIAWINNCNSNVRLSMRPLVPWFLLKNNNKNILP